MKIVNNTLTVSFRELADLGVPEPTIKDGLNRYRKGDTKNWAHGKDETDERSVLIYYDSLADKYKKMLRDSYCGGAEPFNFLRSKQIKEALYISESETQELMDFTFPDGKVIPPEQYQAHEYAVKLLKFIANTSKADMKRMGYHDSKEFWDDIIALVRADRDKLPKLFPTSYNKLQAKKRGFITNGVQSVPSKHMGRVKWTKVKDGQLNMIKDLAAKHQQLNAEQILVMVNHAAKAQGWTKIGSVQTVRNYIKAIEAESSRKGYSEWRNYNDFIVGRERPSAPNLLWVGDATPYELYYQEEQQDANGHLVRKHWKRKVVYAVIDAFNDLIVGFAIGTTETAALAKQAWKNACTNTGVMPRQIKTDRFALTELRAFYELLALNSDYYTPSAVGNARDKVIEPLFAKLYDFVTRIHNNASGRGIRAKEQANREYLLKIKHEFPGEEQLLEQITGDLMIWNAAKRDKLDGKSLLEQWLEADHSRDRILDDKRRLMLFGQEHKYTNTLTNRGLVVTLGGKERVYMDFVVDFYVNHIGKKFYVVYDEDNLEKIMALTEKKDNYFILSEVKPIPMAYADMKEGDRERLNTMLRFKKDVRQYVLDQQKENKRVLEEHGLLHYTEPEVIAKTLFITEGQQKQVLYEAQNKLKELDSNDIYDEDIIFNNYNNDNNKKSQQFNDGY